MDIRPQHSIIHLKMYLNLINSIWKPKIGQLYDFLSVLLPSLIYMYSINKRIQNIYKRMMKQQKQEEHPILFYGKTNPEYQFLSNFYPAPFKIEGHIYPTNQHFFQSQKFVGKPQQLQVIQAEDPKTAKQLGRKLKMDRPQNWPDIKQGIMLTGLRAKFSQNKDLLQKLLKTGNRKLRQHTHTDKYWGDGGKSNNGKNRLGVLLMQVREQFKNAQ